MPFVTNTTGKDFWAFFLSLAYIGNTINVLNTMGLNNKIEAGQIHFLTITVVDWADVFIKGIVNDALQMQIRNASRLWNIPKSGNEHPKERGC
jgi:hypothetical protein